MSFARGYYELIVDQAGLPHLCLLLNDLSQSGTTRADFFGSLYILRAEISRGRRPDDLDDLAGLPGEYAVTVHGFRVHLRISEAQMMIWITDVETP